MVRYWEASLPASHIPSDSKIENFIRTKYSSKRWILSPTPPSDPAILDEIPENVNDESQDSVPLAIVKQSLQQEQQQRQAAQANLLETDTPRRTPDLAPLRTESASPKLPSRGRKERVSNESLLGLDFDSPVRTQSAPQFPSITTSTTAGAPPVSRNDLKNSILRLYAPKPVAAAPSTSVVAPASTPLASQSALGDLNSAFSSLSTKSTPLTNPSITTSNAFSGFNSSGLSFGQTSSQQPSKPVPVQPTSFTIPIKKTSSGITTTTSPSIPTTNKSSLPPPISTPQISTSTKTSSNTIPASLGTTSSNTILPTSNYAPTFNLSKSPPPPPQVNQSTTAPPPQKSIQLLSSLTPTTTTSAATTSLSSTPAAQNISSSFANPWAATSTPASAVTSSSPADPWASPTSNNSSSNAFGGNAFGKNSDSAFGGSGFGGNPAGTFGDAFTSSSQNTNAAMGTSSSKSFGATSLSDGFSSQNPSTAKGTNSNSSGTSFGDNFSSRPAANPSHSNSFSVSSFGETFSSSSRGMGDNSWGGSTTENTTANESGMDKKFDDFGLFETADVWK